MSEQVFVGEPVRKSADVLELHLATLAGQTVKPVGYIFIDDNPKGSPSSRMLAEFAATREGTQVIPSSTWPECLGGERCGPFEHLWDAPVMVNVGWMRTHIMRKAREAGARYLFMCDSDIVIAPDTIEKLIEADAAVAIALIRSLQAVPYQLLSGKSRSTGGPMWKYVGYNVWEAGFLQYFDAFDELHAATLGANGNGERYLANLQFEFHRRLETETFVKVGGGGACTLFDLSRVPPECDYRPMRTIQISDWGEDRWFQLRCEVFGVELIARTDCEMTHIFEPSHAPLAVKAMEGWGWVRRQQTSWGLPDKQSEADKLATPVPVSAGA